MSVHRLIALIATMALVGLLGMAQANNNAPTPQKKVVVEAGLREKIRNADIDGCGG